MQSVANVFVSAIGNREARNELEEMHSRISDAFYPLNENWKFTYLTDRAEELIDFTEEGLVGEHVRETFEWAADSKLRTDFQLFKRADDWYSVCTECNLNVSRIRFPNVFEP